MAQAFKCNNCYHLFEGRPTQEVYVIEEDVVKYVVRISDCQGNPTRNIARDLCLKCFIEYIQAAIEDTLARKEDG